MASSLSLCRRTTAQISKALRFMYTSTTTRTKSSQHNNHKENHNYLNPSSFIGSWEAPKDPKEAEARLSQLRRDYAKQVKQIRKLYIEEVELMNLNKLRQDESCRETLRLQNEERKKLKAEAAKARAEERQVAELEFRQSLINCYFDAVRTTTRKWREESTWPDPSRPQGQPPVAMYLA